MTRHNSKTGCITCVVRKKKCDEALPICNTCRRLNLTCVKRAHRPLAVTTTNLRVKPERAISNGHPPFRDELEKQIAIECSTSLSQYITTIADQEFRNVPLFGRLCTQNQLVRDAIVAFVGYGQDERFSGSSKHALISYQSCIAKLRKAQSSEDQDVELFAIMFLGFMEGTKLGNAHNALVHFLAARRLLVKRLQKPVKDAELKTAYTLVAEAAMYIFATMSPFEDELGDSIDWLDDFDAILGNGRMLSSSPFLGGFHETYRVIFAENVLLRQMKAAHDDQESLLAAGRGLRASLNEIERQIHLTFQIQPGELSEVSRYRAKHLLTLYAARIHLAKIMQPLIAPSDEQIRRDLTEAVRILKTQDITEPGNRVMRWPLIVLACATNGEESHTFMMNTIKQIAAVADPASADSLLAAVSILDQFLNASKEEPPQGVTSTLDFLLKPRSLLSMDERARFESVSNESIAASEDSIVSEDEIKRGSRIALRRKRSSGCES